MSCVRQGNYLNDISFNFDYWRSVSYCLRGSTYKYTDLLKEKNHAILESERAKKSPTSRGRGWSRAPIAGLIEPYPSTDSLTVGRIMSSRSELGKMHRLYHRSRYYKKKILSILASYLDVDEEHFIKNYSFKLKKGTHWFWTRLEDMGFTSYQLFCMTCHPSILLQLYRGRGEYDHTITCILTQRLRCGTIL
jgi:hypothetical protein